MLLTLLPPYCINASFNPNTSKIINVKNNNSMPPAINLPEKLVDPIFMAINSFPKKN